MVRRTHWMSAIERLWEEKSVVWLKGVRRAGKTFLCQSLPDVEYLQVLEETMVVNVVRPFSTRRTTEVVAAPKVYGFDTGFVCHFRGWARLGDEDRGPLWEHYVLNEYLGRSGSRRVFYWRDRRGHEIDFVFAAPNRSPVAVECKWRTEGFNPRNVLAFRTQYPEGTNYVVTADAERTEVRDYGGVSVRFVSLSQLAPCIIADLRRPGGASWIESHR